MHFDFLFKVFEEAAVREAVIFRDRPTTYAELTALCRKWSAWLERQSIPAGSVIALHADYSPDAIALLLALGLRDAIVLQAGRATGDKRANLLSIGEAEAVIDLSAEGEAHFTWTGVAARHELYQRLRQQGHPGLVLFSSGSTGAIKGVVHDLARLLLKYRRPRQDLRTIAFLLFDHIGGIDTLFYCLSNGSAIVVVEERAPASVCEAIQKHRAQVLPVAPTFLNLLYLSGEFRRFDLSSLVYVTYGAEMMPEQTLKLCAEMFPSAKLLQKYGTSEVGTPRSQSKSSDSLWMKLGGEGFRWRVVDGILQIQAEGAMLGYLNAPSPFTEDGWFVTGDCVEVEGEYIRILGRDSDIINVGGRKVYPAEVESVVKEVPDVFEVTVRGEANAILGQIVTARVWARPGIDEQVLRREIRRHAAARLDDFKVPVRIEFSRDTEFSTERFKKLRTPAS